MSRIPAALLVLALLAPTGCAGGLSSNQSKGMMYGGGAAVFMGSIVALDGLTCNDVASDQSCDEDRVELRNGVAIIGVGVVLGALGYLLRPQPANESATATTKKPPPVIGAVAAVPE